MENYYFRSVIDSEFKQQNRIELVTQIRNPFTRFVSNYVFGLEHKEYSETAGVSELSFVQRLRLYHSYRGHPKFPDTNSWNMYCRVLSRQFQRTRNVTAEDLETAKSALDAFDLVTVLEMEDAADLWAARYGLGILHSNRYSKYGELYAAEKKKHSAFDRELSAFQKEFETLNRCDYLLYEYAQDLHRAFAEKYLT